MKSQINGVDVTFMNGGEALWQNALDAGWKIEWTKGGCAFPDFWYREGSGSKPAFAAATQTWIDPNGDKIGKIKWPSMIE